MISLLVSTDSDGAGPVFSEGKPVLPVFDPMVDRVPEQMDQRFAYAVQDPLVDLRFLAEHLEVDILVADFSEIPNHPVKPGEYRSGREHADPHDRILEVPGDMG